jgi:hypothetical protein
MGKAIYKMSLDFGRMGDLTGVFVADTKDVEELIKSNKEIYFGEVLGKHSEVMSTISSEDLELVTSDESFIELFEKYDLSNGYNPFDYIEEEEE